MSERNLDKAQAHQFSGGLADAMVGVTAGPEEAASLVTLIMARLGDQVLKEGEPIETVLEVYDLTIARLQLLRDTAENVGDFLQLVAGLNEDDNPR